MKIITLTLFLFCGIAGAYAQTNNNAGTLPEQNPSRSIEADSIALVNDGANKNDSQIKSTDSTSQRKNPITDPEYKTDPRNENEKPKGKNPTGKTTTPDTKKSTIPHPKTTPSN